MINLITRVATAIILTDLSLMMLVGIQYYAISHETKEVIITKTVDKIVYQERECTINDLSTVELEKLYTY